VPAAAVMKEVQPHSYYRVFFIFLLVFFFFTCVWRVVPAAAVMKEVEPADGALVRVVQHPYTLQYVSNCTSVPVFVVLYQ